MRGLSIILALKGFVTLNKVINFDKNETESKMENLTHRDETSASTHREIVN